MSQREWDQLSVTTNGTIFYPPKVGTKEAFGMHLCYAYFTFGEERSIIHREAILPSIVKPILRPFQKL